MVSADPKDIAGVRGRLAYGSRDGVDASAGLGTTLGSGFLSLFGSYGRGDGFIPTVEGQRGAVDRQSPYEQASIGLRGGAPLSSGVELRSEEHTSELPSLMRNSYAVFCLQKKNKK